MRCGDVQTTAWGVFRLPDNLRPGELKQIRVAPTLPRSFRGLVSEHATREDAYVAWTEGSFVREIG